MPNGIPLSSKLAAHLVTLGTFTMAVGTYLLAGGNMPFNWGDYTQDIGLTLNLIAVISNFAVVALRRDALPFVKSGIGTEISGIVQTTTVSQETKTTP